jgi:hypothetical protein
LVAYSRSSVASSIACIHPLNARSAKNRTQFRKFFPARTEERAEKIKIQGKSKPQAAHSEVGGETGQVGL